MRTLFCSTAIAAIAITSTTAQAEDVSTERTDPIQTATIKNGTPDAINITSDGSVDLTSGTAVTMNSDHDVANAGTIEVSNATGATGIAAIVETSGDIVNTGTITVDEPYEATDDDNDGDLDGPFAIGSDRYGIRTLGAHSGDVTHSGTILVEGNDSAGLSLGGTLSGDFTHDGKTTVTGDGSVGVEAQDIDGAVRLAGTVQVQGEGAVGARFTGDISGPMVVQGTVASTGYRYTTAPTDPTKLDADDLLQGGSALIVAGDVDGGIVLAIPPQNEDADDADEDSDGIDDAAEGSTRVVSYGEAAAFSIRSDSRDVAIGAVAGTASQFGLQIDGKVEGLGVYAGVDANGLVIAGQGHAVTIANGIGVAGTVSATSVGGDATAIRLGSGASTPMLRNAGTIAAKGSADADTRAAAIVVESGADLATIQNSGSVKATATGENGTAIAILDQSGTLGLIENSGAISASGAKAGEGRNIAIDLTANASGAELRQTEVASGFTAPSIVGDVRFGSGNDTLDLADGTLKGDISFGAGTDTLMLSGDAAQSGMVDFGGGDLGMILADSAKYTGSVDFAGGAGTLALSGSSIFSGSLSNAANLALSVDGGILDVAAPASVASLTLGANGTLVATLDGTAGAGTAWTVSGDASFAEGSTLVIQLADVSSAEGTYTVVTANSITGLDKIAAEDALVPYMFKATIVEDAPANQLDVDISRRSVAELGLNRSGAAAYDAVFAALAGDDEIADSFLAITDGAAFRDAVASMLPDHAGGVFAGISQGEGALIRQMQDPASPLVASGAFSVTAGLAMWDGKKDAGDTGAYDLLGYSFSLTGEYDIGIGQIGLTVANISSQHTNAYTSDVTSNSWEVAGHWRGKFGPVAGFARGAYGTSSIDSKRTFEGMTAEGAVKRTIDGDWDGNYVAFAAGASAEGGWSKLFFRPQVMVDYIRLDEDAYVESGGGSALDLSVNDRTSDELGVSAGLVLGLDLMGMRRRDSGWFRVETEGGWREVVSGDLGKTTARFEGGDDFTLQGETSTSGWYGRLRLIGGPSGLTFGGELSAEERFDDTIIALRTNLRVVF